MFYVPESFQRRYREMRSTNDTIASVATVAAGLLYGLAGYTREGTSAKMRTFYIPITLSK